MTFSRQDLQGGRPPFVPRCRHRMSLSLSMSSFRNGIPCNPCTRGNPASTFSPASSRIHRSCDRASFPPGRRVHIQLVLVSRQRARPTRNDGIRRKNGLVRDDERGNDRPCPSGRARPGGRRSGIRSIGPALNVDVVLVLTVSVLVNRARRRGNSTLWIGIRTIRSTPRRVVPSRARVRV